MKILTGLVLLIISFVINAEAEFQLSGSYALNGATERMVLFHLEWEEKDEKIQGYYSDNYYTRRSPVRGEALDHGRSFLVSFPDPVKGIKTITLLTSRQGQKDTATTVPFSIITRDGVGNPVTAVRAAGQFLGEDELSPMVPPRGGAEVGTGSGIDASVEPCVENFGVLAGFCGAYQGTIVEEIDLHNHCALLGTKRVHLVLDEFGAIVLRMDRAQHDIGRIRSNPESRTVEIFSRSCDDLDLTKFPAGNCKMLHLIGSFSAAPGTQNFTGNYSVQDEITGEFCKYGLSMSRKD